MSMNKFYDIINCLPHLIYMNLINVESLLGMQISLLIYIINCKLYLLTNFLLLPPSLPHTHIRIRWWKLQRGSKREIGGANVHDYLSYATRIVQGTHSTNTGHTHSVAIKVNTATSRSTGQKGGKGKHRLTITGNYKKYQSALARVW